MITKTLPISDAQYERFQNATMNDPDMTLLKKCIIQGWPINKNLIPEQIRPYVTYKDELSVIDEIIYKNTRLVVPSTLRKEMLNKIHYNHLGMEKCKNRAREILFWPGMPKQISDIIQNCETCQRYQRAQTKESFIARDIPEGPWQIIGIDLFHYATTSTC